MFLLDYYVKLGLPTFNPLKETENNFLTSNFKVNSTLLKNYFRGSLRISWHPVSEHPKIKQRNSTYM